MSSTISRRDFVRIAVVSGAALATACGGGADVAALREEARRQGANLDCSDISGLFEAEARTRTENQYRQHTEKADQFCLNCLNFVPPKGPGTCATCRTVRGPINPDGWCKQWTAKRT